MRAALLSALVFVFTLHLYAAPVIKTASLPAWLFPTHPDLDKVPPKGDINDGFYYELIDLQTNLGLGAEYTHLIKVITNESGVQDNSEVSVTFAPQFQQVVFHRIAIIRDGIMLDRLQPDRIKVVQEETDADEFQYNGLKRAFLTLKDVRKGDKIDVSWSVVGFNPVFANRFSDEFSLSSPTAVCNYNKTIITTPDRRLNIRTVNNAPAPVLRQAGATLVYSWDNPPLGTDESGSDAPSWYNSYPTVFVSEFATWQDVVGWGLNTFNNYRFPLPADLLAAISGWETLAKGDKDRFASLATRFVQDEIRYLGLEIGANTHRPHPPAEVFSQRFGDCKDKALLLSAILRHEGIPAYVALVNTDKCGQLATVVPSPEAFDHAIVAIRHPAGDYAFIDPTRSQQRGGLTGLFIPAYGLALVLRESETALQPVPPGRINDYDITESLDARNYDTSRFTVTSIYDGGAADDVRNMFAESSRKKLQERYRKYYATLFGDLRPDGDIEYDDDSLRDRVIVRKHYSIPQWFSTGQLGGKYLDYTAQLVQQTLPDPSDAPADAPLALTYPFNLRYTLDLSLPPDWDDGGAELHIRNKSYQFDFVPETDGDTIRLRYVLRTFSDHISAADIREYKEDYKAMEDRISFRLAPQGEAAAPARTPRDWKVCWPAIWLTFFFSLLFSRLFHYLNIRSETMPPTDATQGFATPPPATHRFATYRFAPGSGYPLGGWLILLGVNTGSALLIDLIRFVQAGYYNNDSWSALGAVGGGSLQYLYMARLAIRLSFIACGGSVLFWYIKRRDIFPRMFIWYTGILLSGRLLLLVLYYTLPVPPGIPGMSAYVSPIPAFILTCGYAAIWVTYILTSGQVKATFLEPFRERIR
jgi:hypothetical protein